MRRMPLNASEIEKFTFISGAFSFYDEVLENASKTAPYNKLIQALINTEETEEKSRGIILFDYELPIYYIGYMEYDSDIYLFNVRHTTIGYCHINYDKELDKMTINLVDESLLSTDDIKTIFGQDITGTGDITLYRHQILVRLTSTDTTCFTYYSTNDLKVDSVQDLRTLLGGNEWTIGVTGRFTIDRVNDINGVSVNLVSAGTQLSIYYIKIDGSFNIANALGATISDVVTPMTTLTTQEAKK